MAEPLLDLIPPELVSEILAHACRSRKDAYNCHLVCQVFHDLIVSAGHDVCNAEVYGVPKMSLFLDLLKGRDVYGRRVRSLLLVEDNPQGAWRSLEISSVNELKCTQPFSNH